MQSNLVNRSIDSTKILSVDDYNRLSGVHEFILYGDNILEGITLLNDMTKSDWILALYGVIYEPIDQPIYLFKDSSDELYAIKICGSYEKWNRPAIVTSIIEYIDLPDYIFYSVGNKCAVVAGENTETASVGNSQWQREGRKLGAAKNHIPFIYQTFYSGKDESQDTIREPSSLQVYNHLLYSIRYRVPSFVAYFDNNFEGAKTRERIPVDCKDLFADYLKASLFVDVHPEAINLRKQIEERFFVHMIDFLKEPRYETDGSIGTVARLDKDFPVLNAKVRRALLQNSEQFASDLVKYIYDENDEFITKYPVDDLSLLDMSLWAGYTKKQWISSLIDYLSNHDSPPKSYISGQSKVGFGDTKLCKEYLISRFPDESASISRILNESKYPDCLILPLRIHKRSNGELTFSPDPESGEIAAFCELFGYNYKREKKRPVVGYVIVETPEGFNFSDKKGTKLYKSISEYVDIIIFNDTTILTDYPYTYPITNHVPSSILMERPLTTTEEMSVVSTYLNLSTIKSSWRLCFIHTHHSSWQQLVVYNPTKEQQQKIDRVSTKPDLIMQDKAWHFMVAEGKDQYIDLLRDGKIRKAMENSAQIIDALCDVQHTKFNAFMYNLPTEPSIDPQYYVDCEVAKVKGAIQRGHFNHLAFERDFVIIIVYWDQKYMTRFKLVYSDDFTPSLKTQLDREFDQ